MWSKQHESLDLFCLLSMVDAAGCILEHCHTLVALVPTDHRLHATVYQSIVAHSVHPCPPAG